MSGVLGLSIIALTVFRSVTYTMVYAMGEAYPSSSFYSWVAIISWIQFLLALGAVVFGIIAVATRAPKALWAGIGLGLGGLILIETALSWLTNAFLS